MKTLKIALQTPVLVLMIYVGSINLYETARVIHTTPFFLLNWTFFASIGEGILEVILLIALYRWLGRPSTPPKDLSARGQ